MTPAPQGEQAHKLIRSSIVGVFTLVGPAMGTAAVLGLFVVDSIVRQRGDPGGAIWAAPPPTIFLGYLFGLGPAVTAGLFYALVPRIARRIVLSPFYGAAAAWVFYQLAPLSASAKHGLTANWLLFAAGALAAFGCALLVRKLGIDGAPHP